MNKNIMILIGSFVLLCLVLFIAFFKILLENSENNININFVFNIIIILLLALNLFYILKNKKTQINNIEKNEQNNNDIPKDIKPVISNIKFQDVAGVDELKIELREIVDFLKNSKKYKNFGIKMPKGLLMVGPPGVGKTLIARAVAGEAGVPFFYQNGSSFVEIYVGMGAKRVRELFNKAKMMAPSIIFIDEIDAVGKIRGELSGAERDNTLNELLTQMDGFEGDNGVMVIAATNKVELMDPALLRSGRFDRRIFISLPELQDRIKILNIYLKDKKNNVNIQNIAKATVGFSAASLETLVNEAAINALRKNTKEINENDFFEVLNKVLVGKKKILSFNDKEKQIQAIYQAAKALSAYYFDISFEKITLIEDRFNEFEHHIKSKSEILNRIKVYLAGNAAMNLIYNESFTNSQSDILRAKELVAFMLNFNMIDENILTQQQSEMKMFLEPLKNKIKTLANILLEHEKIESKDVSNILNNF